MRSDSCALEVKKRPWRSKGEAVAAAGRGVRVDSAISVLLHGSIAAHLESSEGIYAQNRDTYTHTHTYTVGIRVEYICTCP
jgi:hypothetical protein